MKRLDPKLVIASVLALAGATASALFHEPRTAIPMSVLALIGFTACTWIDLKSPAEQPPAE